MTGNKRFTMDYEETYRDVMYLDNGKVMTDKEVLDKLNTFNDENEQLKQFQDRVFNIIDKNIDKLQKKYDFGQKNGMCPMYNILHSINTLKDLKKELEE